MRLAAEIGGEIVNADALQLYRDLRVLSARPSAQDEARAPHHLFGVADAADGWSVGRWLRAAEMALAAIEARGRPAIVVGGTGLYLRALTQGLADIPPIPGAARAEAERLYDDKGEAALRKALSPLDPAAETRIAPGDRQRLLARARRGPRDGPLAQRLAGGYATDAGARLLARLRARAAARCALRPHRRPRRRDGRGRLDRGSPRPDPREGLSASLPAMKAVGLREFADPALSSHQANAAAAQSTRRYAKRQLTWFRHQTPDWPRIAALETDEQLAELGSR